MKTFDNGNLNVSVIKSKDHPKFPGEWWNSETYLGNGIWRWVRVNGDSQSMREFRQEEYDDHCDRMGWSR